LRLEAFASLAPDYFRCHYFALCRRAAAAISFPPRVFAHARQNARCCHARHFTVPDESRLQLCRQSRAFISRGAHFAQAAALSPRPRRSGGVHACAEAACRWRIDAAVTRQDTLRLSRYFRSPIAPPSEAASRACGISSVKRHSSSSPRFPGRVFSSFEMRHLQATSRGRIRLLSRV
jgi:hypothetical protein